MMEQERAELTSLEIRNLLLEAISYEDKDIDVAGLTFKMYGYCGSQADLFRLAEGLAIKRGMLNQTVKLAGYAWGCGYGQMLFENHTTNFSKNEIHKIYEEFGNLLSQGIIAPGAYGNYGPNLPYFHVTEYGFECLKRRDFLPYDIDGYLKRLLSINGLDQWVLFYVTEALRCFNANCINSSMINLGLAGEVIAEKLIESFSALLKIKDTGLSGAFEADINVPRITISTKYIKYLDYQRKYLKNNNDTGLQKLANNLDVSSSAIYATYTRLTRNSLAHPNDIVMDRIEVLMFFITFIKYCELQFGFVNYYQANS